MKTLAAGDALPHSQVIRTKLAAPEVGSRQVLRPELYRRFLGQEQRIDLLTVVGAAGSGKSSVLAELVAQARTNGWHCCWLGLDPDDDDPAAFANYLVLAIEALDERSASRELSLLRSNPVRDFGAFFNALVGRISRISKETLLVLDDFQHLSNPQVLDFWNRLISHAPPTLKIAIASRLAVPLDIARKRVAGTLMEVRQEQLNFDTSEARQFLSRMHGLELATEAVTALVKTTEGWPAGLQLVALSLAGHDASQTPLNLIRNFSGQDRALAEYLIESVLRALPAEVRQFLLSTSPLARMSGELCEAVAGIADGRRMLESLVKQNLFLLPLDRERGWYRYHHLFAEFLQAEFRRRDPEGFQRSCETAAQWCDERGMVTEAIRYALLAEQFGLATRLIANRAPEAAQLHGDHYTVLDWMRRLPDEYHRQHPAILLAHAWSRAFSRDTDRAIELSNRALDLLGPGGENERAGHPKGESLHRLAQVIQAIAIVCSDDDLPHGLKRSEAVKNALPDSEPFHRASILVSISYCLFSLGRIEESTQASSEAYKWAQRSGTLYAMVWADFMHSLARVESGTLEAAAHHAERALGHLSDSSESASYPMAMATLARAQVFVERCDFVSAGKALELGRAFSSAFGPLEPVLLALQIEARTHAWNGSLGEARAILAQGRDMALSSNQPRLYLALAAEEVDILTRYDDWQAIDEVIRSTQILSPAQGFFAPSVLEILAETRTLTQARSAMSRHRHTDAVTELGRVARHALHGGRCRVALTAHSLRAAALWHDGKQTDACRELDRAVRIAMGESFHYPLLAGGPVVSEIVDALVRRKGAEPLEAAQEESRARFLGSLLRFLRAGAGEEPPPSQESNARPSLAQPLTQREIEILSLISAGLPNKKLASELFISEPTVKWHLHNIFNKFGVHNRTAAAARARQLNLI